MRGKSPSSNGGKKLLPCSLEMTAGLCFQQPENKTLWPPARKWSETHLLRVRKGVTGTIGALRPSSSVNHLLAQFLSK